MENLAPKKYEPKQIKPGKYEFCIAGIVTTDANGYDLKTQKGNSYKKIKLILIDGEETHTVFKFVFSRKDIKEIVLAIANPALTHVFNQQDEDFDEESLMGESGLLLMGKKFNEKDGLTYPQIECFLKPKIEFPKSISLPQNTKVTSQESQLSNNQSELEDGVPF